jgi:hypothetical protein
MIRYIEIAGTSYPFVFGHRAIAAFTATAKREYHQVGDMTQLSANFDAVLAMYEMASKRGSQKEGKPELALSASAIEDAMDEDPLVSAALNQAFIDSMSTKFGVDVKGGDSAGEQGK